MALLDFYLQAAESLCGPHMNSHEIRQQMVALVIHSGSAVLPLLKMSLS